MSSYPKDGKTSLGSSRSLRQKQKNANNLGFIQSMKGYFTNLSYKTEGFKKLPFLWRKSQKKQQMNEIERDIFLFGVRYDSFEECRLEHGKLIWFTYRKNIHLRHNQTLHSDIGWGCLIRVAQMALARAIQHYFTTMKKQVSIFYIITPFLEEDGPQFKYNINRFMSQSDKYWQTKAGQWFSMTQIATIMEKVHQTRPLKGTEHLKVKAYHENIYIKDLLNWFGAHQCECIRKKIICPKCKSMSPHKQDYYEGHSNSNPEIQSRQLLLIVTARLGNEKVDDIKYHILLKVMELSMFSGCLGGIPKQARFITGKNGDKLSYLDPHYVLESVNRTNLCQNLQTFQCKQYRLMSIDELDPSIGLCFYLHSVSDLAQLADFIEQMSQKFKDELFFCYEWDTSGEFEVILKPEVEHKLKTKFEDLELSFSDLNTSNFSHQSSFFFE